MAWMNPVFNRTQKDVDLATRKIAEWIASDINGTTNVAYELKGCLNVSDINRIEGNIKFLSQELSKYYYYPSTSTKAWVSSEVPDEREIKRILDSIKGIIAAFYKPKNAPDVPNRLLRYEEVNNVEKNLFLIKELLDGMVNSFKKSGTFQSGKKMFLPIRR